MLERTIKHHIEMSSKTFPVLLLTGPRRIGKSVLLSMIKEEKRKYVSLDNLDDRNMARDDPAMFLQKYTPPIIIDEVQYAPELFTNIKIWVDRQKSAYLIIRKEIGKSLRRVLADGIAEIQADEGYSGIPCRTGRNH